MDIVSSNFKSFDGKRIGVLKGTNSEFILEIVHLIEAQMHISIDKNSFNYSRFASHMQYLFRRKSEYTEISSTNKKLFELLKNEYPMT